MYYFLSKVCQKIYKKNRFRKPIKKILQVDPFLMNQTLNELYGQLLGQDQEI